MVGPEKLMSQIPEGALPENVPPLPVVVPDPDKQAAIRAATYYDRVEAERERDRRLMEQAKIALEVQLHRVADLQKLLDDERRMHASTQQLLNVAIQDKADLEAILATEQDHHEDRARRLSGFDFSRNKRRNGKHKRNGDSVPDVAGSTVQVDLDPSVLNEGV